MESHSILNGRLNVYKREESRFWQCATYINGKYHRKTTKERDLDQAKDFAIDWYTELCARLTGGENPGKMFAQAARTFVTEYETITQGRDSPDPVQIHKDRLRLYLVPFFGTSYLSDITSGAVQQYRVHRLTEPEFDTQSAGVPVGRGGLKGWKPPGRTMIENEIVTLRMVLETAQRHGWIAALPDLSDPYEPKGKTEPRPWFTPWEYRRLCDLLRRNAENPTIGRDKVEAGQLRDYVIFMVNAGLTPTEADALRYRDVQITRDDDSGERILEIAVRGRRGVSYCKSTPAALCSFERMIARNEPKPADYLFSIETRNLFNRILTENNLKFDRNGKTRTAHSLRHSYICFRLLEGVSLHELARNCRTSAEMIEKHYAAHLKDMIDAMLVSIRSDSHCVQEQPRKGDDSCHRPEA